MDERRPRTLRDRVALVALPAYWVVLFTATHVPRVPIPRGLSHGDKLLHFLAFGILAFLLWQFMMARRPIGDRFVWAGGAGLIGYAAVDEFLQQFVGRHTDLADLGANTAGIVCVLAVLELRRRWR